MIGPFITSVLSVLLLFLKSLLVFNSDFNEDLLKEPLITPLDKVFYFYKVNYYFNYFQYNLLKRFLMPLI